MLSGPPSVMMRRQSFSDVLLNLGNGTFARNYEGYYLDVNTLKVAAIDVRRFEDRDDGHGPIFLSEGSSTNLLTRSEEFDHADWDGPDNATVTANTDVAPDGNQTADTITDDDGSRYEKRTQSATIVSGSTYTFSIFVKKDNDESRFPEFQNADGTGSSNLQLNTKTGETTFRSNALSATASVDSVSDWWRVSVTFTASGTTYIQRLHPAVTSTFGNAESSATGSVVCWGAQLEESSFPTSYIKTVSATATRAADSVTFTAAEVPEQIRSGSFAFDWYPYYASDEYPSSGRANILQENGGQFNGIRWRANEALEFVGAASEILDTGNSSITFSRHQKITITVDQQAGSLTVEGATTGNGTYTGTPDPWDAVDMGIGGDTGINGDGFGRISNIRKA